MYSFPRFTRLISLLAAVISVTTIFAATAPTPAPLPAMTATKVPGSPFKFEIVAPTTAYTNESIDVTVRVVDKDGTVVPSYHGTILFNSSDLKAELPYQSLGYQLRPEDRGEKVFSKGVNFKNIGSFNLEVNDINDDISGSVKVKVEARDTPLVTPVGSGSDVVILTPEDGSTQAGKDVTITGKTKKNSKVGIFLNGKDAGNVISDTDGSFIKTATNLTEKEYILQVKLYDSTNMVVASSKETKFSFANELPTFAGISITEGTTVETGTGLHILVDAEGGLASVKVTLDTVTLSLTETQP